MGSDAALFRSLGMSNPYRLVRGVIELLKTINDPSSSDVEYGINALISNHLAGVSDDEIATLEAQLPNIQSLYQQAYDPKIDRAALMALPAGTLGHEFACFLEANKIEPLQALLNSSNLRANPLTYALLRAYKLHDIMHVVMGCEATVLGEVRIVSFSYAQGHNAAPAIALGTLLMHLAIKRPGELMEALQLATEWYQLGRKCRPHVTFRFEDHWDEPVNVVRARYLEAA